MNYYQSNTYLHDLKTALGDVPCMERLKNRSILVTGASGLIGSYIVDMLLAYNRLENANITIYALARSTERLNQRFGDAKTKKLIFVEQDVCDEIALEADVDYIIHAASNAHPAAFSSDPVGTIMSNVLGTENLLRFGSAHKTRRLLFISTGEVYGQCDENTDAFREDYSGYVDPLQARSCYPTGKRAAETLCVTYSEQYGLDTVIARPCHCYGPNVTSTDNRATVQFINKAMSGEDIVIQSTGKQLRSYCYIADCAAAILTILLLGRSGEAYNVANSEAMVTVGEFAAIVASQSGRALIYAHPEKVTDATKKPLIRQVLSAEKVEKLGWKGRYSVEEGITHTMHILNDLK